MYCADGRSIRVKRQDAVGSPVPINYWSRLWKQILPQFETETTDLENWMRDDSNSSETVVFDPTSMPSISPNPMLHDDVVVGSVSEEGSMTDAISGQNQTEILEECNKIGVKDLREICVRVATNPILKKMSGVRAYAAAQPRYTTSRGFAFDNGPSLKQVICGEEEGCPVYNPSGINQFAGIRSLSPWTMCHEFDPNRFPQWLNKAKCLCDGCISAVDGKEDKRNVYSQKLAVDIAVLRKDNAMMDFSQCTRSTCREGVETISIGCHCALIKVVTPA